VHRKRLAGSDDPIRREDRLVSAENEQAAAHERGALGVEYALVGRAMDAAEATVINAKYVLTSVLLPALNITPPVRNREIAILGSQGE
jgi:hypothetical protein